MQQQNFNKVQPLKKRNHCFAAVASRYRKYVFPYSLMSFSKDTEPSLRVTSR